MSWWGQQKEYNEVLYRYEYVKEEEQKSPNTASEVKKTNKFKGSMTLQPYR